MTRTAIVVGAGIGGLGVAVGLRRTGWEVTVLERAATLHPVGAGLVLQANGLRCLDALGVGAKVRADGQDQVTGGTRRADGRWLARIEPGDLEHVLGAPSLGMHRAALHAILLDALPSGTVVTGAEVVGATTAGEVTYRDRATDGERAIRADLVIGADGIRSVVRRMLWPEAAAPVHIGVTAWRGVTPIWKRDLVVGVSWDRGAEFGMVPLADRRVYWFGARNSSLLTSPEIDRPAEPYDDERARVRAHFGRWHDPIPALIDATDTILCDDLACLDEPLTTYVKGRVALLGDAAHAMTPHLGQGANQALEDAVVLAAVAHQADGLVEYDRRRRRRSQQVARASRRAGRLGQQLADPVAVAARNALVRITPPRLALHTVAHYADWRPPAL